jgi:hypothetical protein
MTNGRCRMHGGLSTGPRTREGLARLTQARTVHGGYGLERRIFYGAIREMRQKAEGSRAKVTTRETHRKHTPGS